MLPAPPSSPVLFHLGALSIRWYGVTLALALVAGLALSYWLWRKAKRVDDQLFDLAFWVVLAGFVGGRLYHVLNEWPSYRAHPGEIIAVWHGGLAIHGALLLGALALWLYTRRARLPFMRTLDLLAPGVALGQAIGRFGNYINQELLADRPRYRGGYRLIWRTDPPATKHSPHFTPPSFTNPLATLHSLLH